MKTTCLINNFNYGQYILQAVNSAIEQSIGFSEIIVVDDGSKDNSVDLLLENFSDHPQVKLILKDKNEGQLSCFNEGIQASTGDLIFFLDSDDLYEPFYLEQAINFYDRNPDCDFLFCAYTRFGNEEGLVKEVAGVVREDEGECRFGCSVLRVLHSKYKDSPLWIGSITSTLSMKRIIADRILPIPFVEDWKVRADDCLIWGASLVGALKIYTPIPWVRYRIHSTNDSKNNSKLDQRRVYTYQRFLKVDRLFGFLCEKMNYTSRLVELANLEFRTIPSPKYEDFKFYFDLVLEADIPFSRKLRVVIPIVKQFVKYSILKRFD